MDFSNIEKQMNDMKAKLEEAPAAPAGPVEKEMDAAAFHAYCGEQLQKAQAEQAEGKAYLAKARIAALQEQVTKVSEFTGGNGRNLPSVSIYKDPAQASTTETTKPTPPSTAQSGSAAVDTFKSIESDLAGMNEMLSKLLDSTLNGAEPTPTPAQAAAPVDSWPADLAKSAGAADDDANFGEDPAWTSDASA